MQQWNQNLQINTFVNTNSIQASLTSRLNKHLLTANTWMNLQFRESNSPSLLSSHSLFQSPRRLENTIWIHLKTEIYPSLQIHFFFFHAFLATTVGILLVFWLNIQAASTSLRQTVKLLTCTFITSNVILKWPKIDSHIQITLFFELILYMY